MDEKKEKDVAELMVRAWNLVDYVEGRLLNPSLDENEKIRWAGVLATVMGTLSKLMWGAGMGKMDKESLAKLFAKIPKKYREVVLRGLKRRVRGSNNMRVRKVAVRDF